MLTKGDKVVIKTREGALLKGLFSHIAPNGKLYIKAENGMGYERAANAVTKVGDAETKFEASGNLAGGSFESITITPPKSEMWDVNKKFQFLAQLTRMVINGISVSLVITGEGGLGKTYTVKHQLMIKKMSKLEDYVIIKGFSTAKGLYKTLFENNGKLIIFDDCDEVLEDKIAKNLLKGALDSYDSREISWISQAINDDGLPSSFEFTGRIIFISNLAKEKIDQALLSRSMNIDLTMSSLDKISRMEWIVDNSKDFMPQYTIEMKRESIALIKDNIADLRELSLRSLEKVLKIRAGEFKDADLLPEDGQMLDWKDLAKFMLLS